MKDVISLGIGEPDFTTPNPYFKLASSRCSAEKRHYTSNFGIIELRRALANHLEKMYGVRYDPETEIIYHGWRVRGRSILQL